MNLVTNTFPTAGTGLPALDLELSLSPPGQGAIWRSIAGDARLGFSTRRGRNDELQQTDPGTMLVVLENSDREFDPDYSSSPLYGHIKPVRRVRLLARYNSITYVVFDGFVDQWLQQYPELGQDVVVSVSATDGFKILAKSRITGSPYDDSVIENAPVAYYKFDDSAAPTILDDSSGNSNDGTYTGGTPTFVTGLISGDLGAALDAGAAIETEGADLTGSVTGDDYVIEFWISTTSSARAPIVGLDVGGASASLLVWMESTGEIRAQAGSEYYSSGVNVNDGDAHHIVVRRTGSSQVGWVIDGVDGGTDTGTATSALDVTGGTSSVNGNVQIAPNDSGWSYAGVAGAGVRIDASIDALAIYAPASSLTVAEAQAHYTGGSAPYSGDASGARVATILNAAKWPSALRDLDTGTATLQASASYQGEYALDLLQTLDQTEAGQMYMGLDGAMSSDHQFKFVWRERGALTSATRSTVSQATFGVAGGSELQYADVITDPSGETFLFNDIEITRRGGDVQHVTDADSIEQYLIHTLSRSGLEFSTDAQALTLANALLTKYKAPHTRIVALVIKPQRDPADLWPQVLGREIGDLITVKVHPAGVGSAISRGCIIVGVEHELSDEGEWTTTWRLSEADTL